MRNPILLAFAAAFLVIPMALSAQSATITATAEVIPPLTVTGARDLDFGEVIPGFPRSVTPDNASSGLWQIGGTGTYEVELNFTLPATLTDLASNAMNITFGATDAAFGPDNTGVGTTDFDPNGGGQVANLTAGALWVYLGGTVTPGASQPAGNYDALVDLQVAYTGS
jgi:hypothetical protein